MKEGIDISHYLNIEMPPELKQSLSDFHSKRPISAKLEKKQAEQSESSQHSSASDQTLPSEPLTEVKGAEHPEQEVASSSPRRISPKQRQESLESYREAFLSPHKIIDRKATYLSRSTWERLEFVVHRLGNYGANVSSFLECIALRHLEEYNEDIERWRKL